MSNNDQDKNISQTSKIDEEAIDNKAKQDSNNIVANTDSTLFAPKSTQTEADSFSATESSSEIAETALDDDRTVFAPKEPLTTATKSNAAEDEASAPAEEINDDRTVFSPRTQPVAHSVTGGNQTHTTANEPDGDRTVFSPRPMPEQKIDTELDSTLANQIKQDATRFRPSALGSTTATTDRSGYSNDIAPEDITSTANLKMLKERFVLEEVIGVGGMGVVYKAKDLLRVEAQDKDPYVAIKVLSDEFRTHPEAFISLQRESKKAQHIANQNTVKVYDFDRDNGVVFMTMEFMVGQPLDEMVKQYHATGLPQSEAFNILSGMCSALVHAHSENIVHSDLKPGNVFVTDTGIAKIFDFGIARAVAKIDRSSTSDKDRTVFDAGNLGALTPAYASREMLLGQTPDVRDDIYALGCIAYEMLTGDHPFTRLPADEAYDKKLKPKRIQGIKKRHWKAIEAALQFERKDRINSVEAFQEQLSGKKKANYGLWLGLALSIGGGAYTYNELTKVEKPAISQAELMNQIEFKVRYELLQESIASLIQAPLFTDNWQTTIWQEMKEAEALFPEQPTPWYFTSKETIYTLYLTKIESTIEALEYKTAALLIENAKRFTDDTSLLEIQNNTLVEKLAQKAIIDQQNKLALEQKAEQQRIQAEKDKAAATKRAKKAQASKAKTVQKQKIANLFNLAMENVETQLACNGRINMRDFKVAIDKLRSLDNNRYLASEVQITNELAGCIGKMAEVSPDYARDAKRSALRLFKKNPAISALVIKDKDGCQLSIAGLGARGARSLCKDPLADGGTGPSLVVIPKSGKIKAFAVGKYEVSINEYNFYCHKSQQCKPINSDNKRLPVTNISVKEMTNYTKWLSQNTGKKYRIPTKTEWTYAANAKNSRLDSNRNCKISSRGISKGKELVKTTTGKTNNWGLVNSSGNAQEIVYIAGRKLEAVGGSFKTSMDVCTSKAAVSHSGQPDEHTGFRIVRDLIGD